MPGRIQPAEGACPAAANDAVIYSARRARPTLVQRGWLARGLDQPGGKLPLFDQNGREVSPRTITSCVARGWAEPWIRNPIKPDWLVCRLTERGRAVVADRGGS